MSVIEHELIDIGGGHTLQPLTNEAGGLVGYVWEHDEQTGLKVAEPVPKCYGMVDILTTHKIAKKTPLTLKPSLACSMCKAHGHVIDGKWEDAMWEAKKFVAHTVWKLRSVGNGVWRVFSGGAGG